MPRGPQRASLWPNVSLCTKTATWHNSNCSYSLWIWVNNSYPIILIGPNSNFPIFGTVLVKTHECDWRERPCCHEESHSIISQYGMLPWKFLQQKHPQQSLATAGIRRVNRAADTHQQRQTIATAVRTIRFFQLATFVELLQITTGMRNANLWDLTNSFVTQWMPSCHPAKPTA